jgi:hypothetical protein
MPITYEPIATTTVTGSSVADITFSSISGTYTDLLVVAYVAGVSASGFRCQVGNGSVDTGSNYSRTSLFGRRNGANTAEELGSSRSSSETTAQLVQTTFIYDSTAGYSPILIHFMNYSNTTTYKTLLTRHSSAGNSQYRGVETSVNLWRSTSAINTIKFFVDGSNTAVGSNITLYGIKAA